MTTKSLSKLGRPIKVHRTAWGEQIPGLTRLKDGRWRVLGARQVTFSETEERLAVARFHEIRSADGPSRLGTLAVHPDAVSAMLDMARRTTAAGGGLDVTIEPIAHGKGYAIVDETLDAKQWRWLREQIIARPKWVAHASASSGSPTARS